MMMTFKMFAGRLAILSVAFDNGELSEEKVGIYWDSLMDIPAENFERGVHKLLRTRTSRYLPTIAEIREASLYISEEEIEFQALNGWSEAKRALTIGDSSESFIKKVVELAFGSYQEFGKTRPENESFDRSHFIKAFKLLKKFEARSKLLSGSGEKALLEEKKE